MKVPSRCGCCPGFIGFCDMGEDGDINVFFRGENTWFLIEQKDLVPAIPVAIHNVIIIFECV